MIGLLVLPVPIDDFSRVITGTYDWAAKGFGRTGACYLVGEARALGLLGPLVAAIDEAAEERGIEKVKTIGGSSLSVCGLSVTRPDHFGRMVQFAQAMDRIVAVFNRDHQAGLRLAAGREAAIRAATPARERTGDAVAFHGPVRIETPTREQLIVSNASPDKSAFSNLSRSTTVRSKFSEISFSYHDPPNGVTQVMLELLEATPGVLTDPPPAARTVAHADFSISFPIAFEYGAGEPTNDRRRRTYCALSFSKAMAWAD